MKRFLIAAALLATAVPQAQAARSWTVDPAQSTLGFSATMAGAGFEGRFERWTADIAFDPADLAGSSVKVAIDMTSAVTGDPSRDQSLPNADWFDTSNFPQAVFEAHSFADKGGGAYEAQGTLTIRGASKPLALPFTLSIADDMAKATGAVTLMRTDYGVGQGQWALPDPVAHDVKVTFAITAQGQ